MFFLNRLYININNIPSHNAITLTATLQYKITYTVHINVERFAGLNICGFHPMRVFMGNFPGTLRIKYLNSFIIQSSYI